MVKLLAEDLEDITGGKVALGDEPKKVVEAIEAHINEKRKNMGLMVGQKEERSLE